MWRHADDTDRMQFTANVLAPPRPYGPANRTALVVTMVGCEPVYSVLSGILQPDVTPPQIGALSVAAACSGIDTSTSMLDMRLRVKISEPAEVCS